MNSTTRFAVAALCVLVGVTSAATPADVPAAIPATAPAATLALIEPLVGAEYRIDAKWIGGGPLKARETYEWGPGKTFIVCKTFVKKDDGSEYLRYQTMFGIENGVLTTYAFTVEGRFEKTPMLINGNMLTSEGTLDKVTVRQSLDMSDPNQYSWKVAIRPEGQTEFHPIMDGVWKRVTP